MASAHLSKLLALSSIFFLGLGLLTVHAASFDCSLSVVSSTGAVQGAQVDLACAVTSGTELELREKPIVLYDGSLNIRTMTGDTLSPARSAVVT